MIRFFITFIFGVAIFWFLESARLEINSIEDKAQLLEQQILVDVSHYRFEFESDKRLLNILESNDKKKIEKIIESAKEINELDSSKTKLECEEYSDQLQNLFDDC